MKILTLLQIGLFDIFITVEFRTISADIVIQKTITNQRYSNYSCKRKVSKYFNPNEHEFMHALGFYHEQARPDAKKHIKVQEFVKKS